MELLDERWTLLVVRELVTGTGGSTSFGAGCPGCRPTLLSKRLQQLVRPAIVSAVGRNRRAVRADRGRPGVAAGRRGARRLGTRGSASSATRTSTRSCCSGTCTAHVDHAAVPVGRAVLQFCSPMSPLRPRLVAGDHTEDVDVCDADPGHEVAVTVTASLRSLVQVWRGDVGWSDALRSGGLEVRGPQAMPGLTMPTGSASRRWPPCRKP